MLARFERQLLVKLKTLVGWQRVVPCDKFLHGRTSIKVIWRLRRAFGIERIYARTRKIGGADAGALEEILDEVEIEKLRNFVDNLKKGRRRRYKTACVQIFVASQLWLAVAST